MSGQWLASQRGKSRDDVGRDGTKISEIFAHVPSRLPQGSLNGQYCILIEKRPRRKGVVDRIMAGAFPRATYST